MAQQKVRPTNTDKESSPTSSGGLLTKYAKKAQALAAGVYQMFDSTLKNMRSLTAANTPTPPAAGAPWPKRKYPRAPAVPVSGKTTPRVSTPPVQAPQSGTPPGRWVGPGKSIDIHGITITGGLLYAGSSLKTALGMDDPCLINPSLPIAFRSSPVKIDGYWPSYAGLNPQARRTYLEWLATGRKDPTVDIGYVFLFFYGLERRAILDAALDSTVMRDYPLLAAEISRLLAVYENRSKSFQKYARKLLDWVTFTNEQKLYAGTGLSKVLGSLMKIKFALGQAAVDTAPIPAKLMLAWVKEASDVFVLRTPAIRCPEQFDIAFETRYREQFGSGTVVPANKTPLKFIYTPASAGFSSAADIAMSFKSIPDVTQSKTLIAAIEAIVEKATQTIEPYSRFLARNPQDAQELDALVLLPNYLWPTAFRQSLHALKRTVIKNQTTMACSDLLALLGATSALNLSKFQALANAMATLSIGMEPDVFNASKAPLATDIIALFDLPQTPDPARDGPQYRHALAAAQLVSTVVAQAYHGNAPKKQATLRSALRAIESLPLPENHRVRLKAQATIGWEQPIKLLLLFKQLQTLTYIESIAIFGFAEQLLLDGQPITTTENAQNVLALYHALGLDAAAFEQQYQALLLASVASTPPKTTVPKKTTTNIVHSPGKKVKLNLARIAQLHKETDDVATLMGTGQLVHDPMVLLTPPKKLPKHAPTPQPVVQPPPVIVVPQPKVRLDFTKIAELQTDTKRVDHLLSSIFHTEHVEVSASIAVEPTPATVPVPASSDHETAASSSASILGLDTPHTAFAKMLLAQDTWTRAELEGLALTHDLMLDGALERINDACYDVYDQPLTDGDDVVDINQEIKEHLS